MFDRLMGEIRGFTQHPNESLVDAWLRMKDLLRTCHRHGLGQVTIIQIFYHGLHEATQAILDVGGIFLYKTPNEAHQLLKDRVLLKLDWSKDMKAKPICKTVAFAEISNDSKLMEKMEALTTKIDSQFKDIKGEMKEMRDGCNSCGGPHPSSKYDEKPMGGPKDEEANYAYGDENRTSQPREDAPSVPPTPKKKFDESDFEKPMRKFMVAQKSSNDFVKNQFLNLKTKVEQGQKNHQASIQDLETKFGRLSDQCSSRPTGSLPSNTQTNPKPSPTNDKPYRLPSARNKHVNVVFTRSVLTYDLPVNPNAKTIVIHDDSEDGVDEAKKEVEPSSSKQTKSDQPPPKAYKLKISYPQRLRKEKMEECYAKFIDLIKEVRINVPLIDVLAGMPNYGKFLKDLVSNKSKMEKIYVAFLNEKCLAIVQNKLPPKLGDPRSFLIPCTIAGSIEYLALADLGRQNSMHYSMIPNHFPPHQKRSANHFLTMNLKFMAIKIEEIPEQEEEVENSFEHLEHAFLEKESLLPVVISALLQDDKKKRLVSVLKKHKEAFAWKTSDIPGISPSFCKHKINFEDDAKPVIQRQRRLNLNMKEVMKN
ncbi:hypothetical protein Tco_0065552 [Tanacetum coccineum]